MPNANTGPPASFILSLVMKKPTDDKSGSNIYLPIITKKLVITFGSNHEDNMAEITNPGIK